MREYRAEQIVRYYEILKRGSIIPRKLWKYLIKNRGEIIFGKEKHE